MIVNIFSVVRKGTQSFTTPRKYLFNVNRLFGPAKISENVTQLLFNGLALPTPPEGVQVEGNFETIQNSLVGSSDPNAVFTIIPNKINGVANTLPVSIQTGNILYGIVDVSNAANVILFVVNPGNPILNYQYTLNTTTLEAQLVFLNNISDNIDFSGTFGACATSTQAYTYQVNQAVTLQLQVNKGIGWESINTNTVSVAAGTAAVTFNINPGDAILNDPIRVIAIKADGTIIPISSKQFACTGGSASGSGTPVDCGEYAYFDGAKWNNAYKELNIGATCTVGYSVQVASDPAFTKMVYDLESTSTLVQLLDIPAGTYYARVANLSGVTEYSSVLTFVAS